MFQQIKLLSIFFLIILVPITNSFATSTIDSISFYGKGRVVQSSTFAGQIVWIITDGKKGAIIHSTNNSGVVVVRLALSESAHCLHSESNICYDATVSDVTGTDIRVGDKVSLDIDLKNRKEIISVTSGEFKGETISINLLNTKIRSYEDFSLKFSKIGGIVGLSQTVTLESSKKTLTVQSGLKESKPFMIDDKKLAELKESITKSRFFDITPKEYPPLAGSADYFSYSLNITTQHLTNNISWADTAKNVPKKLILLQKEIESIISIYHNPSKPRPTSGNLDTIPVTIARNFTINSPTFKFDGIEETLKVVKVVNKEINPPQYVINIDFVLHHGGYGDRTGQIVIQALTHHTIAVTIEDGKVISAIIDEKWDEVHQKSL